MAASSISGPVLAGFLLWLDPFGLGWRVVFLINAAVAGLLFATSLYLQFGRGLAPLPTAGLMTPLSVGVITASFFARGLAGRLGRRLVVIGLIVMSAGTLGYLAVILLAPDATWALLLNAVQQIASAAGAALISAAYLAAASTSTGRDAVAASLVIVLIITALSLAALPLLPRRAAVNTH